MIRLESAVVKMVVICMAFLLSSPIVCFAETETEYKKYTIDTSKTGYGCYVDKVLTTAATAQQRDAIKYMRDRALIPWYFKSNTKHFYYMTFANGEHTDSSLKFEFTEGDYRGVLYQHKVYDTNNPLEGSREHWLQDRTAVVASVNYMINNGKECVRGTDCSSSAVYAWRSQINGNNRSNGVLMFPKYCDNGRYYYAYNSWAIIADGNNKSASTTNSYGNYVDRVGQYGKVADNLSSYGINTKDILLALRQTGNFTNNATVYTRVYSKMLPGDFLVKYFKGTDANGKDCTYSHVRLIEQVQIVKNSDGTIDPDNSYVVVTEQTARNDLKYTDVSEDNPCKDYRTTWRVRAGETKNKDGEIVIEDGYSFRDLATKDFYLPYRYNGNTTSPVAAVTAASSSANRIDLNWAEIEVNCDGYELLCAEDSSFTDAEKIVIDNPSENSTTLDSLDGDSEYYVKVRSYYIKEDGEKEYSDYSNWIKVAPEEGILDRENAPDKKTVGAKVYSDYINNDIPYDYDEFYEYEECVECDYEPQPSLREFIYVEGLK